MSDNKNLDAWLTRASSLSQVLMVAVVIFGYFYTVRPIYEKDRLTEEVAQKSLELQRLERSIVDQRNEYKLLVDNKEIADAELQRLKSEISLKEDEIGKLAELASSLAAKLHLTVQEVKTS